jgi:hypothetical protein
MGQEYHSTPSARHLILAQGMTEARSKRFLQFQQCPMTV